MTSLFMTGQVTHNGRYVNTDALYHRDIFYEILFTFFNPEFVILDVKDIEIPFFLYLFTHQVWPSHPPHRTAIFHHRAGSCGERHQRHLLQTHMWGLFTRGM